jgi:hypothetical protein
MALNNLGARVNAVGRREEAETAWAQAVALTLGRGKTATVVASWDLAAVTSACRGGLREHGRQAARSKRAAPAGRRVGQPTQPRPRRRRRRT